MAQDLKHPKSRKNLDAIFKLQVAQLIKARDSTAGQAC